MTHPSLVVFSDLDGTLLDHTTYAFDAARPAIERLRRLSIPLVLCTSKTRSEVELIRQALHNDHPCIVENGGGGYVPRGYFPFVIDSAVARGSDWLIPIGDDYQELVDALARASAESGVAVRGFADMTDAEVASATGLDLTDARRAREREFDEPFMILDPDRAAELLAAIEREGKRWTAGGRFYHIIGGSDKAVAVRRVAALYTRYLGDVVTIGLGDAPNDAAFLNAVDIPILIDSPQRDRLHELVPDGRVTERPGPEGWNDAIEAVLDRAWATG